MSDLQVVGVILIFTLILSWSPGRSFLSFLAVRIMHDGLALIVPTAAPKMAVRSCGCAFSLAEIDRVVYRSQLAFRSQEEHDV